MKKKPPRKEKKIVRARRPTINQIAFTELRVQREVLLAIDALVNNCQDHRLLRELIALNNYKRLLRWYREIKPCEWCARNGHDEDYECVHCDGDGYIFPSPEKFL